MTTYHWWQTAVFYQIYPRSFADGSGDGIGDLRGIIEKLDYLKELGIDAIWLSPHFPSPNVDCGYDISDYTDVDPDYGTLAAFKHFLSEAHQREIRVILDLVLNHTSDQHAWFRESRSSRGNPKRDWYVWHDPQPEGSPPRGAPPNNWYSTFGSSAWEYDETTQAYYYHFFFKEQPDLNWRNPEVKKAVFDAVRFWLELGVDGFRLDAVGTIYEDPALPDQDSGLTEEELFAFTYQAATPEERKQASLMWHTMFRHQHDQPGVHELMRELRLLIDEYDDRVLVGETDEISFYGTGSDELHLVFNFPLARAMRLAPELVRENQKTRLALIPSLAWPCNTLGNHDSPRVYNRFGDGIHNDALARLNLVLLLTLKGTPFLYNGEEIGMSDYLLSDIADARDRLALLYYHFSKEALRLPEEEAVRVAFAFSRDKNRTPNQWADAPNAGFSPAGVRTWLPVNPNYAAGINAADQGEDPASLLNFYRRAMHMRRHNPALIIGDYQPVNEAPHILAYLRIAPEQRCLVVLNFGDRPTVTALSLPVEQARLVFSTHPRQEGEVDLEALSLDPFEAAIFEVK